MPLYTYQCDRCGATEDVLEKPQACGGRGCLSCMTPMRRLFPTGVRLINSTADYHRRARRKTLAQRFQGRPDGLARLKARARKMGFSVSGGDYYEPEIARDPEDPLAAVPHDDPLGHIRKVCVQRGLPCEGMVTLKAPEKDPVPDKGPPLAEDIIRKLMTTRIKMDPSLKASKQRLKKLREDIINRHAPKE